MNAKIKELLVCKYNNCNKYFEEPIILSCGTSVCKAHVDDILDVNNVEKGKYNCKMCNSNHEVPLDGFIINRDLKNFFQDDSHLPDKQKKVKDLYVEFEATLNSLKKMLVLTSRREKVGVFWRQVKVCNSHFRAWEKK